MPLFAALSRAEIQFLAAVWVEAVSPAALA